MPHTTLHDDQELSERLSQIETARAAIVAHVKERGQRLCNVGSGFPCPVCADNPGGPGALQYYYAGAASGRHKGSIRAQCSTEGCVSWIE